MTTDYETLLHPTMSFCALLILLLSISWATAERSTWTDRQGESFLGRKWLIGKKIKKELDKPEGISHAKMV